MKEVLKNNISDNTVDTELNRVIKDVTPLQWVHHKGPINEKYIDSSMHLVFYGVGSSSIEDVTNYLKLKITGLFNSR